VIEADNPPSRLSEGAICRWGHDQDSAVDLPDRRHGIDTPQRSLPSAYSGATPPDSPLKTRLSTFLEITRTGPG
jgi:hypothetical protein